MENDPNVADSCCKVAFFGLLVLIVRAERQLSLKLLNCIICRSRSPRV